MSTKGIQLPCPCCGEKEANISLHLDDMDTFTCAECEAEFSRADIEAMLEKWGKVLA